MTRPELPAFQAQPFLDLIKDSWLPFKDNWILTTGSAAVLCYVPLILVCIPCCIVVFLSMLVAGFINKGLMMPVCFVEGVFFVVLFAAAYNFVRAGWTKMLLRLAAGKSAKFSDLKSGMPWFINYLLTCFLLGIATAIGTCMLVVPGIIIAIRTSFAPFLVIDENLSPMEALLKSNELADGYSWQLLGYHCIMGICNLIFGLTPLNFVLAPASMAFFDLVLARLYLYRKGQADQICSLPPGSRNR